MLDSGMNMPSTAGMFRLEMVTAWEKDHTQPNPYVVIKSGQFIPLFYCLSIFRALTSTAGVTEADVKPLLAKEEAELAAQGVVTLNEVNASAVVVAGLDLQDHQ
jgi:hypothetical protein